MRTEKDRRGLLFTLLFGLLAAAFNTWIGWCAYVAFTGGTLPIPLVDVTTRGGIYPGLMFLVFGVPIVSGAARLLATAIYLPLAFLASVITVAIRHGKSGSS